MSFKTAATIADLYQVAENGQAELVNGEQVIMVVPSFYLEVTDVKYTALKLGHW